MNKKKGIIIGAVLFILAVAVGYAIFSDTLTINGTATAKGEFAFEITTQKEVSEDVKSSNMYAVLNNYGSTGDVDLANTVSSNVNSSITNTSNTVTYSANLTQPGQKQYFTVKVTNTGSIPIILDIYYDINIDTSIAGNLLMDDGNTFDVTKLKDATIGGDNPYGFTAGDYVTADLLKLNLVNLQDVYVSKNIYDELDEAFNDSQEAAPKLDTGESAYLVFSSYWKEDCNFNAHVVGIDVTAKSTIDIPIKQYTN